MMNRLLTLFFVLLFASIFVQACDTADEPIDVLPTPDPTATLIVYPDTATLFIVDRSESRALYKINETFLEKVSLEVSNREPGENKAVGNTPSLEGVLALDLNADPPKVIGGHFVAGLDFLRTNQPRRDERLRLRWLETNIYPTATFVLDEQTILEESYLSGDEVVFPLTGNMTVRNVTIPITFTATASFDKTTGEIRASADAPMLISAFGIEPPSLADIVTVDDEFEIGAVIVARLAE
ncbi:MAG: YceI family protein [Anaerolineae bacterium]